MKTCYWCGADEIYSQELCNACYQMIRYYSNPDPQRSRRKKYYEDHRTSKTPYCPLRVPRAPVDRLGMTVSNLAELERVKNLSGAGVNVTPPEPGDDSMGKPGPPGLATGRPILSHPLNDLTWWKLKENEIPGHWKL
jgi:hypothetical protein